MDKDEIAFKIVELYTTEIADPLEKRKMGLDTVMNAYFYVLLRLTRKEKEMEAFDKAVTKEEQFLEARDIAMKKGETDLPKMEAKPEKKPVQEEKEEFKFD